MSTILPITNLCNQNCLFCSAKERKDQLKRGLFGRIIEQTKDNLVISGGEPTLSTDLFWVIRESKKRKLSVELQTNGATLYNKDFAAKLVNSGVDLFNINFPSSRPLIHNRITQTSGLFEKKIEGLKLLQRQKANFRLTFVINSLNYRELGYFVDSAVQNIPKPKYIQFSFIKIIGLARKNPQILVTYEEVQPYLLKALKRCQKHNIDFIVDHIPTCYLEDYKKYHIDYQKIMQGEKPEYSLREKVMIEACHHCSWSLYCCGVRKDYLKFFGRKAKVKPIKST